jgi:hypothetical protein
MAAAGGRGHRRSVTASALAASRSRRRSGVLLDLEVVRLRNDAVVADLAAAPVRHVPAELLEALMGSWGWPEELAWPGFRSATCGSCSPAGLSDPSATMVRREVSAHVPAPECNGKVYARGLCGRHYKQWRRHGQVLEDQAPELCAVPECGRAAVTRGWCHGHYVRWSRAGT